MRQVKSRLNRMLAAGGGDAVDLLEKLRRVLGQTS
jgi:hypothetical protein